MKHNLLFVIFFRLQHLEVESNDFGISSFICNALQTRQILLDTQLLRKIMLCKVRPVITFDIYFYQKSFTVFYYKYYRLNPPLIFFTNEYCKTEIHVPAYVEVCGIRYSILYRSLSCWTCSFQAKEGCILAKLELLKIIGELEKCFFSAVTAAPAVMAAVTKEYLLIMIPPP